MKRALILGFIMIALAFSAFGQTKNTSSGKDKKDKTDEQTPPPTASVNPSGIEFKDQVVRKASKPQRITITNTGGKKLYINSVVVDGDNKEDFALAGDTCTGATIAVNKSCVVDIAFAPSATERRTATLVITDNAIDSPQKVTLSGKGINSSAVPPGGQ